LFAHLPDMLVSEIPSAVSAAVEPSSGVDVSMLPHVVRRRVVLAAHDADVTLLPVFKGPEAVALSLFGRCGRGIDLVFVDDVVGVVVGHVVVLRLLGNR